MNYLLHPEEDSLFTELRRAGYYVWMNDRNDLAAGQMPGWIEEQADEIFSEDRSLNGPGPNPAVRGPMDGSNYYTHYRGKLPLDEHGKNISGDDQAVNAAIERILHPVDDRPQCLFLGLNWPHVPYQCEEPYFSAIDPSRLPERIRPEDCSGKPRIHTLLREYSHMENYTEEEWNRLRTTYLGMCMKVDEQFGRVISALKKAGCYENTLILFMSDHGDFTGDYGLVEKAQNSFEDCLTRVPFIIKPPVSTQADAGVCDSMVELVDLYATVMDYAGVTPSHTHYGRSLRPVLSDRSLPHRNAVFSEGGRMPGETHCDEWHIHGPNGSPPTNDYWPKQKAQSDDIAHGRGIMIRTQQYKYISRVTESDELYDLTSDPQEKTNRIHDPDLAPVVAQLQIQLLKWLQSTVDVVPYAPDSRFSADKLWNMVRRFVFPDQEAVVRAKIAEGYSLPRLIQFCKSL